jgi:AcrR family transcriptional regulator
VPERSLDGRRARGDATRARVLHLAADMATEDGLEGLTLTRLGQDLGISRSNVHALFGGSKLELQLATVAAARSRFIDAVIKPVQDQPAGSAMLSALLESWCDYIAQGVFPGGCFVMHGLSEYGNRTGQVRDALISSRNEWQGLLRHHLLIAVARRELAVDDVDQLLFELGAALAGANTAMVSGDLEGPSRGRRAVRATLARHEVTTR